MESLQQWWKRKFSFKNATIVVCFINLITVLFLLQSFLSPNRTTSVQDRYLKESEELRKAMEPLELIKRVREIQEEVYRESEPVQNKETKQTTAADLVTRLNNVRASSDNDNNMKALEEWRKRKMERAKQRELGKNGTTTTQS